MKQQTAKQLLTKAKLHKSVWGKRIIAAEENGRFKRSDRKKSSNWVTCACGELDERIPRRELGYAPLDHGLRDLGSDFYEFVSRDLFVPAAKTLIAIEARAIEVLEAQQ